MLSCLPILIAASSVLSLFVSPSGCILMFRWVGAYLVNVGILEHPRKCLALGFAKVGHLSGISRSWRGIFRVYSVYLLARSTVAK